MTQSHPRVIDAGDIPDAPTTLQRIATAFDEPLKRPPEDPKAMHKHLLEKAQVHALAASDNAYDACDWYGLLDKATADRYRKSARHLYELSEHLTALIEES